MLRVDLSALRDGPIELDANVATDDPLFRGIHFNLAQPVHISGRLTEAGSSQVYWRGRIRALLNETCSRCLEPVTVAAIAEVDALFSDSQIADDPSVYAVGTRPGELYLGDAVREELLLAVPGYVLCQEDCRGLCPKCGANRNTETCDCAPEVDRRWAGCEALKDGLSEE